MTQVTLKTIEQNDNVGMFSICFVSIRSTPYCISQNNIVTFLYKTKMISPAQGN